MRLLRLLFVIAANGTLFYFGVTALLSPSEMLVWRVLEGALCAGLLIGVCLEAGRQKLAKAFNVGVPVALGTVLASSVLWLPMVARVQHWEHPADAYEGSPFLLISSLVPFVLAGTMELVYRLVDISPDSETAGG